MNAKNTTTSDAWYARPADKTSQTDDQRIKDITDWEQYGGAPVLGFDRIFIKAHGRSQARAIANAGKVAAKAAANELGKTIQQGLAR